MNNLGLKVILGALKLCEIEVKCFITRVKVAELRHPFTVEKEMPRCFE